MQPKLFVDIAVALQKLDVKQREIVHQAVFSPVFEVVRRRAADKTTMFEVFESGGDGAATIVQKCLYATKVIIFFDYNSPNLLFF